MPPLREACGESGFSTLRSNMIPLDHHEDDCPLYDPDKKRKQRSAAELIRAIFHSFVATLRQPQGGGDEDSAK